jgi:hypothetical protein
MVDHRHRAGDPGVTNGTAATPGEAKAKFREKLDEGRRPVLPVISAGT